VRIRQRTGKAVDSDGDGCEEDEVADVDGSI
jgi:hypothetical protein